MRMSGRDHPPPAVNVVINDTDLRLILADGRDVSAPLAWFPRLRDATPDQRAQWRLIGRGQGVHWPEVDDDVSVGSLIG